MRALVIDDSRVTRTILARMLGQLGFEVTEAADGRQGLERLRAGAPPDLALVDWNMPQMNGYEFVRAVRAEPAYAGVRLLMVTSETELSQVAAALDAGADDYVMKPFTPEVIADKLALLGVTAN